MGGKGYEILIIADGVFVKISRLTTSFMGGVTGKVMQMIPLYRTLIGNNA